MTIAPHVLATRHRLVAEIGDAGVATLAASCASLDGLDVDAADVARSYLERAGVAVSGPSEVRMPTVEPIECAYLRGAHFALEHIARTVGVRRDAAGIPLDVLVRVTRAGDGRR